MTYKKIQQINSSILFKCIYNYYLNKKIDNKICKNRKINTVFDEIYKRTVIPFYILILSLKASSLLIKPKSNKNIKVYKYFIFLIGFVFIIISQIGSKFMFLNFSKDIFILISPLIFVLVFYLIILFKTNFKLKYL